MDGRVYRHSSDMLWLPVPCQRSAYLCLLEKQDLKRVQQVDNCINRHYFLGLHSERHVRLFDIWHKRQRRFAEIIRLEKRLDPHCYYYVFNQNVYFVPFEFVLCKVVVVSH